MRLNVSANSKKFYKNKRSVHSLTFPPASLFFGEIYLIIFVDEKQKRLAKNPDMLCLNTQSDTEEEEAKEKKAEILSPE